MSPQEENVKTHFQIDWLISNLRWLLLVGVALVIFLDLFVAHGDIREVASLLPQILLLIIAMLYNIIIIFLLSHGSTSNFLPVLTFVVDTLITIGLIVSSGGLTSPLLFFALFPILTAALRFRRLATLLVALGVIASFGGTVYLVTPPSSSMDIVPFAVFALVLLVAAVVSSFVSEEVKKIVAGKRQEESEIQRRQLHAAREHARLTFELASTLSATLNYGKVLNAVLEVGEKGMRELGQQDADQIGAVLLFTEKDLRVAVARHLTPSDRQVVFQGEEGALAEALTTARAVVVENPVDDPELGKLAGMRSCRQAVVVPLRAGFESFGAVLFGGSEPDLYTDDLQNLLIAVCNQAIVALQNARLYQNLREEKERIIVVEEDARKRLARDLHDGPTQSIASIAMQINYVKTLLDNDPDPERVCEELDRVEDLARQTTKEIRHMLFTLRPLILETQGLMAALEEYIGKLAETEGAEIRLEASPRAGDVLDQEAQGTVFYIIEEAIANARKHSQARNIWVRLRIRDREDFVAEVEDDGKGFDVSAVQTSYDRRGSLGLVTMRERAAMTDGELSISSAPGEGTRVKLTVPL
ncbi:MAG: GAF domain-containing sensor histidine kinase, partial [Anaerolineae bacterium]